MSKNQIRIHPFPSQPDDEDGDIAPPPAPRSRCVQINCNRESCCSLGGLILGYCVMICWVILMVGSLVVQILQPTKNRTVFFHVVNASLTQFDLTNNNSNTLDYKLRIDINATNPNKDYIINIGYGEIEASAYYQDIRFDSVNLMPFHQDTKNRSTTIHAVFQGQDSVPRLQSDRFYRDKSDDNFDIQVQLSLLVTYHRKKLLGGIFYHDNDHELFNIKCDLRMMRDPLFNASSSSIMNGSSSSSSSSSNINPPHPSIDTSSTMVGGGSRGSGGFQTKECKVYSY